MVAAAVDAFWFGSLVRADVPTTASVLRVVVDATPPGDAGVSVLELSGAGGLASLTPAVADRLALADGAVISTADLSTALAGAGLAMNGPDAVFYLPADHGELRVGTASGESPAPEVRRLSADDAALFEAFTVAAPQDDVDEAFVELDHWLVVGAVVGGELVSAASAYPWRGSTLADLGVVTLPGFRGRGLARSVVRALADAVLAEGHEPQYRCQVDNAASVALARSAGLQRFGTWDVLLVTGAEG